MPYASRPPRPEHARPVIQGIRSAFRGLPLLLILVITAGCHPWIGKKDSRTQAAAVTAAEASPMGGARGAEEASSAAKPPKKGFLAAISSGFSKWNPFHRKKSPPPKALAPRRVGMIRTLSNDGSYVIVELEPGVSVSVGNSLFVTKGGGDMDRLKVTEIQPPFFVADVQGGNPGPGDLVEQ